VIIVSRFNNRRSSLRHDIPSTLIDHELVLCMSPRICVGGCHPPSRGLDDTKVKDLAALDHVIERVHDFLQVGGGLVTGTSDITNVTPTPIEVVNPN
jgi:hypothetical protein